MNLIQRVVCLLAVGFAAMPAHAGTESLSAAADQAFLNAAFHMPLPRPSEAVRASSSRLAQLGAFGLPDLGGFDGYMKEHSRVAVADGAVQTLALAGPLADIDLSALLNRQLKTSLKYNVGGRDVWIGGVFDRESNAYVTVWVDGSQPGFYNVRGLLDKEQPITIGTAKYKLYLSPNVINQMKSEIVLENAADEDDKIRVTLKKMLEAVGNAGQAVAFTDQTYKVFYTDDMKNGQPDKTAKLFIFLLTEASGDIHVFLIPAKEVPSDKINVFKMFKDKRVGLTQQNGRLKVYENP